jgi:hypothetical protein
LVGTDAGGGPTFASQTVTNGNVTVHDAM